MRQDIHTTLSHGSNLRRRELLKASALGAAIVALPMGASAQAAPLRIVVPYVPGGSADIVGRMSEKIPPDVFVHELTGGVLDG